MKLPAFIATKEELVNSGHLNDDTRILYVILPPSTSENEPPHLEIAEHVAPNPNPNPNPDTLDTLDTPVSHPSKKRGRQKKTSAGEPTNDNNKNKQRKRLPLKVYEHCFSTTSSKKRCGYPHQLRNHSSTELLEILNVPLNHKMGLVCKKHGKDDFTLNDTYIQEAIAFLSSHTDGDADGDEVLEQELLQAMEEFEAAEAAEAVEATAKEQTWQEKLSEMISGIQSGIFVIGQDSDGSTAMPEISSDGARKMFLISWNFDKNYGILYTPQDQAFWFITLDSQTQAMKESPRLIESANDLAILKQYVNVPNTV
jgi:hypothetical protein